jgi:hypothetical protein
MITVLILKEIFFCGARTKKHREQKRKISIVNFF